MKRIFFVTVFAILGYFLFSQSDVMSFFSLGFNAYRQVGTSYTEYFFYGYEEYSEAFIYGSSIELSIEPSSEEPIFYPESQLIHGFGMRYYDRRMGLDGTIIYVYYLPMGEGSVGQFHKYENGKLVYWARSNYGGITFETELIEQNEENLVIGNQLIYYNIPRDELLDMFLIKYVGLICEINGLINGSGYSRLGKNFAEYFFDGDAQLLLSGRTSRELAIFRNCLFAIKGYRFASQSWTDFFNKYLDGYNGNYTNDEVMAMFSIQERQLLDLIIQYENRR
jgi:hypothetical protein